MSTGPENDRFEIDGSQVRVVTPQGADGELPPLVLFNGIGAGVEHWARFPEALNRPVIAIDVAAAKGLGRWATMATFAKEAAAVVHEVTDKPVDALGYSWGGLLLQQAALDYPELFDRLVLAATLPGVQLGVPHPNALRGMLSPNRSPEHLTKIAGGMYGGDIRRNPQLVNELGLSRRTDKTLYERQLLASFTCGGGFHEHSMLHRLKQLRHQTLIMAGDDDPIAPIHNAEVMKNRIPNAYLHRVRGGGHGFLLTRPESSAAVINQMLQYKRFGIPA